MQKRLRALLPKDYARDYRRYRPLSSENARLRFFHVKYCTNDRVRKCRASRSNAQRGSKDESCHKESASNPDPFAASTLAFRNYQSSSTSSPGQYVSMAYLDISAIQSDMGSTPEQYCQLAQSTPTSTHETMSSSMLDPSQILILPSSAHATNTKSPEDLVVSVKNDCSIMDVDCQIAQHYPLLTKPGTLQAETPPDSLSLRSLGIRLAQRYSQSTLEHIASVLRSSGTLSRRSSLLSMISLASSKISGKLSSNQSLSSSGDIGTKTTSQNRTFLLGKTSQRSAKVSLALRPHEQRVWDDLIDESQLAQPSRVIPSYPEISLLERGCCRMKAFPSCERCGFSDVHLWAITTVKDPQAQVPFPTSFSPEFVHDTDHFGNRPLHFVAANATGSSTVWRTIRWLIYKNANIRARNTSGETFMHVLHPERLRDTREYLELLQLLAEHEFPFSQRDCHGQTVADLFFASANPKKTSMEEWNVIFSQLKNGIFNVTSRKKFLMLCEEVANQAENDEKGQSKCEKPLYSLPTQGQKSSTSFKGIRSHSKLTTLGVIVKELDVNGDSALICIVKEWRLKEDERQLATMVRRLVNAGVDVHMRDHNGDTSLAIAARRGLRPAVMALLGIGANPNTRNYQGRGILSRAAEYLRRATQDGNTARYASILSCMALLTDHGAKEEPTVYDEFMSPTALAKVNLSPGVI